VATVWCNGCAVHSALSALSALCGAQPPAGTRACLPPRPPARRLYAVGASACAFVSMLTCLRAVAQRRPRSATRARHTPGRTPWGAPARRYARLPAPAPAIAPSQRCPRVGVCLCEHADLPVCCGAGFKQGFNAMHRSPDSQLSAVHVPATLWYADTPTVHRRRRGATLCRPAHVHRCHGFASGRQYSCSFSGAWQDIRTVCPVTGGKMALPGMKNRGHTDGPSRHKRTSALRPRARTRVRPLMPRRPACGLDRAP
jgi:hypothetical protein